MSRLFWTAFLVLALVELYSLLPAEFPTPREISATSEPHYRRGVLHVHSKSSGGAEISEITRAATAAGLDFAVIADLDTSQARAAEGNYGNLDLLVELEVTTPAGHCLVFYSNTDARHSSDKELAELAYRHALGAPAPPGVFVVLSHPSHVKTPWNQLDRIPEGMEVMNLDAILQREISEDPLDFTATLLVSPFNPFLAALRFLQVYPKDLTALDGSNLVSHGHFGVLGHDVRSGLRVGSRTLYWPRYEDTFRLGSNVVFYDPPLGAGLGARKRQLYQSLATGRSAISFDAVYPFAGNDWQLRCGETPWRSGSHPTLARNCEFVVKTPANLRYPRILRLYRDGELTQELTSTEPSLTLKAEHPGAYRLEVWVKVASLLHALQREPVPYVLYNPIYVAPAPLAE